MKTRWLSKAIVLSTAKSLSPALNYGGLSSRSVACMPSALVRNGRMVSSSGPLSMRGANALNMQFSRISDDRELPPQFNYYDDGFTIVPKFIDHEKINALTSELLSISNDQDVVLRNHPNLSHLSREVKRLSEEDELLELIKHVLEQQGVSRQKSDCKKVQELTLLRSTLMDKPANARLMRVGWHQDTFNQKGANKRVLMPDYNQVIVVRIHLDPSTKQNGCLSFLPRSQKLGVLSKAQLLQAVRDNEQQRIVCETGVGDVLLFDPLVVHSSLTNESGMPRRVIHFEYGVLLV